MAASLRQLRAYALLLQERNFTRAAAAMHLSQPAFSALIGGLEQSLGVRLFDRSKRHVAPTVEGADFEPAARRVLAEFDTAIAGVHDRAALRRGRVSLALLPSLAAGWLPDVLARYRARYPGITVDVADVLSEPCIERVTTMRADFALAAVRAETPELQARCSAPTTSTSSAAPTIRSPARRRSSCATSPRGRSSTCRASSSVRQYLDAAFHPQAMDTVMEVDQLATVMGMVRAGLGISVVPALALFHFQQPEIATRPVRLPGPGAADLPRAPARPQPLGGGAGAARSRPRAPAGAGVAGEARPARRGAAVARGRKLASSMPRRPRCPSAP